MSQRFITEGKAKIHHQQTETNREGKQESSEVFYNPVQVFNRDLTVLMLKMHIDSIKEKDPDFKGGIIVDALSASGLRAIRFAKELDNVRLVYSNDISDSSHKLIKQNLEINELNQGQVIQSKADANKFLQESSHKSYLAASKYNDHYFHAIDLDPYGSGVPFLDAAIQACNDDTLVCCTFTDLKVLSGPDYDKCFYYYGANKSKVGPIHENALRIALYTCSAAASRQCKYIQPVLSVYSDFYIRIFFRVKHSRAECLKSMNKTGMVFNCETCTNFHVERFGKEKRYGIDNKQVKNSQEKVSIPSSNCDICGSSYKLNGPVWLNSLNDHEFLRKVLEFSQSPQNTLELASIKKINGILHNILEEKELQHIPYSQVLPKIAKFLRVTTPKEIKLRAAFESLGYKVLRGYVESDTLKSNAPPAVLFDILKTYKKMVVGEEGLMKNIDENSPQGICMKKVINYKPDFEYEVEDISDKKVPIFFPNPEPEWGPKKAAKKRIIVEGEEENLIKKTKIE